MEFNRPTQMNNEGGEMKNAENKNLLFQYQQLK